MKKCLQCGQTLADDNKFCFKCGSSEFEPLAEAGSQQTGPVQQDTPQPQAGFAPSYQQPVYHQPVYQQQPAAVQGDAVGIGQYLLMFFLWWIPFVGWIVGLIYSIIVAVGGPNYKPSYVNFARGLLIWKGIMLVLGIILGLIFWGTIMEALNSLRFNSGYYGF